MNLLTSSSSSASVLMQRILSWIEESVDKVTGASISSDTTIEQNVACVGFALRHVLASLTDDHSDTNEAFIGHCRHICLTLLDKKLIEQPAAGDSCGIGGG